MIDREQPPKESIPDLGVNPEGKITPIKRDFLTEAIKIAEGGAYKSIDRRHLKALHDAYTSVCIQHSALKNKLANIAQQALKLRSLKGLSTEPAKADMSQEKK